MNGRQRNVGRFARSMLVRKAVQHKQISGLFHTALAFCSLTPVLGGSKEALVHGTEHFKEPHVVKHVQDR